MMHDSMLDVTAVCLDPPGYLKQHPSLRPKQYPYIIGIFDVIYLRKCALVKPGDNVL